MAIRKPGPYAPLSAHYADDARIMEVGEDAELMFIRMLAYAARQPENEGWISDGVVRSRLGILPRYEVSGNDAGTDAGIVSGTDAGSRAERLAESGLIVRENGGYRIASWLRWNKSAEEMGRTRSQDRQRKKAPTRADTGNGTGTRTGNDAGKGVQFQRRNTETETETELLPPVVPQTGDAIELAKPDPAAFELFWQTYPKKVDRPPALRAWMKAIRRASIATIQSGAQRYRDDPNREDAFTKNPATWLNADAWTNPPEPERRPAGKPFDLQRQEHNELIYNHVMSENGGELWAELDN